MDAVTVLLDTSCVDDWRGLYGDGWKSEIVPEAFSHPAKFSRALIRHIYAHLLECGLLHEGDTILDPFGGVALGGLDAMRHGLHWRGVELEEKFVALGNANIALWNKRYAGNFRKWGTAVLLSGDSRKLAEVIGGAQGIISSPPYSETALSNHDDKAEIVNQLRRERGQVKGGTGRSGALGRSMAQPDGYGSTPGQLGAMKAGDVDAVIASPPFGTGDSASAQSMVNRTDKSAQWVKANTGSASTHGYGSTPGQLGAMKAGDVDAILSSPPFENNLQAHDPKYQAAGIDSNGRAHGERNSDYGETDGNIGNATGDTFWTAAREIVAQCYAVLAPGGSAVFVVKGFVRAGKLVDFPGDWRRLCEVLGFETLHEHHALLTEDKGTQFAMMGSDDRRHVIKRASFFRRLAEKHGSPPIDFETVYCMRKAGPG